MRSSCLLFSTRSIFVPAYQPTYPKTYPNCRHLLREGALFALFALLTAFGVFAQEPGAGAGVTSTTIRIGSVLDLDGEARMRGTALKTGLEAALRSEKIQGRAIELIVQNDSFDPKKAIEATKQMIKQGIFAMIGNASGPSVKAILPLLAENNIPAVGFSIGVDYLRTGVGGIVNYRASFAQESKLVIDTALAAGVKPQEICAYLPNDAGGIANLNAIKVVLAKQPAMAETVNKIQQIIDMSGEEPNRNGIGPVGFYSRHTQMQVRPGYDSLKQWEKAANTRCRLVMLVGGTNPPTSSFIGYTRYKGEKWTISVTSQVEVPTLLNDLRNYQVADKIALTQVVPALDSSLAIVEAARKDLGDRFDSSSLEGYIVGKMFLAAMRSVKGEISRGNFLNAVRGHTFDLDGLTLDFTGDNQGSDLVQLYSLENGDFKPQTPQQAQKAFQQ